MNLGGGGQIMPQPGGGNTGGMVGRLANLLMRNNNLSTLQNMRKDVITHTGKVKVDTERELGQIRIDQGIEGLKKRQAAIYEEHVPGTPEYENTTPHPITGKRYKDPMIANQAMKVGVNPDAKGQLIVGPGLGQITQTELINQRTPTGTFPRPTAAPKQRTGYSGNMADTKDALDKGLILPEQAAILSRGYNAKNPNLKESSWKNISRVNSNVNKLPLGESN
jgi:hypothetical protein